MNMQQSVTPASPAKLKDGTWGCRTAVKVGTDEIVRITTASGKSWDAKVVKVIWTDGTACVCSTQSLVPKTQSYSGAGPRRAGSTGARRTWRPCGYPGCSPSYCDECDGEGYRSGR